MKSRKAVISLFMVVCLLFTQVSAFAVNSNSNNSGKVQISNAELQSFKNSCKELETKAKKVEQEFKKTQEKTKKIKADSDNSIEKVKIDLIDKQNNIAVAMSVPDTNAVEASASKKSSFSNKTTDLVASAASITNPLKIEMYNGNTSDINNSIMPRFKITNTSSSPIELRNIKLRYYYTIDGEYSQYFWCDYAAILSPMYFPISGVSGKFYKLNPSASNANYYLEIGFSYGTLGTNCSAEVHGRFAKRNWSNYTQSNDYSFSAVNNYIVNNNVTAYVNSVLVSGVAPQTTGTPTITPTITPTNTSTSTPTNTSTNTPTNTSTNTPTNTSTNTPTETPTNTPTNTPTETPTNTPTDTPTNTPTNTSTNTPTETPTNTPTDTPTNTPTETPTNTPTETPTNIPTETPTNTPESTSIPSSNHLLVSDGTTLDEGNSTSNWNLSYNANMEVDTVNYTSGSESLKVTSQAISGVGYFTVEQHSISRNLSDMGNFEINLFIPDVSKISVIGLALFSDDVNHASYFSNYIGAYELTNGWNKIRRSRSDFAASDANANWSNIKCMRVTVFTNSTDATYVNIDRIAYNVQGLSKLMFTFEDGYYDIKTNAYPILEARNFKANIMPIRNITETGDVNFLDKYDINSLYNSGWDVGNHSETHPYSTTGYTVETKTSEYLNAQNWLTSNGWTRGAYDVSYPSGFYDSEIEGILKTIGARTAKNSNYGIQPVPVENIYNIKTILIGNDVPLSLVQSEIDRAIATGSTIILSAHKVENTPNSSFELSTQYFNDLVNYIYSKSSQGMIDVVTMSQWYDQYMGTVTHYEPVEPTPAYTPTPIPTKPVIQSYVPKAGTSLQTSAGTTLEEFDTIDTSYDIRRADVQIDSNSISGNGSIKIASMVPGGGFNFVVEKHGSFTYDLSNMTNMEFNLYIPDTSQITAISFTMYSDDVYHGSLFTNYVGAYELYNGWNKIIRRSSDFTAYGSPSWSNVKCLRITVFAKDGYNPYLNIDKIAYNVQGTSKLLFTFDDAWYDVMTKAKPIMDAKGFKGTLWATKELATGGEADYLNPTELNFMYNQGWDIGNHTDNHIDDITVLSYAEKKAQYLNCQNWLQSNGWTRAYQHICYPQGSYDESLISILREIGVKSARTTVYGTQPVPVENIYKLKCIPVGKDISMSLIKSEIDKAVETGSSIMFMLHQVEDVPVEVYSISTTSFQEIVDYIANYVNQGKLDVDTVSEWYNSYIS